MSRWILAGLFALLATIFHHLIFFSSVGERLEYFGLDRWFMLRGTLATPEDVVIVAMNEESYDALKIPLNEPWPRAMHAKLLQRLKSAGAKKVVFDVIFVDASKNQAADQALATAIGAIPTVLGAEITSSDESGQTAASFQYERLLKPYQLFAKQAEQIGLVGFPEDYGYVRRFLTERSRIAKNYKTLSEACVDDSIELPGPRDLINYYGERGSIPTYSYYQVIDDEQPLPEGLLSARTVFVGLVLETDAGLGQKDIFQTPYGAIFGTEIHASAAANLMTGNWLKRLPLWVEGLLFGVICIICCFFCIVLRPQYGALILGGLVLTWCVSAYFGLQSGIFIPGTTLCIVVMPLIFLFSTLYYYLVTRRAQLQMHSAFELYLSAEMVKQVSKDPKALQLGGEKVWASALFTDIEGFSTLTEEQAPERVSAMLNEYFTELVEVVLQNGGTLIKFIGDAIFVIWGAPLRISDHAEKACLTGIAIQKAVRKFNASKKYPALNTRVGIHTGPMLVGNLGSAKRFDYTAIGDSVNLASRVEGINKYLGTSVLITDATKKEVGDRIVSLSAGLMKVSGKKEVIGLNMIFEDSLGDQFRELWTGGLKSFKQKKWQEARECFLKVADAEPRLKKAAQLYMEQIDNFEINAPTTEWMGELIFRDK